jgi:hypothetical protein
MRNEHEQGLVRLLAGYDVKHQGKLANQFVLP